MIPLRPPHRWVIGPPLTIIGEVSSFGCSNAGGARRLSTPHTQRWHDRRDRCAGARPCPCRFDACTVRSWARRIRLCGRFPYRPTIGGACGMYRPPIGPVSAIERAIVCMGTPGLADLRQPISRGFLHTATSGGAPGFFYARCARNEERREARFELRRPTRPNDVSMSRNSRCIDILPNSSLEEGRKGHE